MQARLYLHRTYLTAAALLLLTMSALAQGSFQAKFAEAARLSEEKEHERELGAWLDLALQHPGNGNVSYRTGVAYLNSARNKTAALPFLEAAAAAGVSKKYDPFSPGEKQSPVELWYYLGKAYHLAHKLDDAEAAYGQFTKSVAPKHRLYQQAQLGLNQVRNARVLMKNPVEFKITNLGPVINTPFAEFSPVISIDENALFFTSTRLRADSSNLGLRDRDTGDYFEDIYVSYKNRKGEWQAPELLEINGPEHTATVNVTIDGQTLYMYRDDAGVGNLYESKLVGERWSTPVKLAGDINSSYWEPHIAVSADGQLAFFISNRPGGLGGRDIYLSRLLPNGEWGKAQNLGPGINTPFEEDAVFISPDGKTLYFCSEGHTSMGGFDIFTSMIDQEGNWSSPVNLGYPINTVDDDVFFVTSADSRRAYYSSFREGGFGQKDIYLLELPTPREVRLALLQGLVIESATKKSPTGLTVAVTNKETGEETRYTPRQRDGNFVAILPPCHHYEVAYMMNNQTLATDTFSLACDLAYQEVYKELLLHPVVVLEDGTARVLRNGEDPYAVVMASTTTPTGASYKKVFGYNENKETEEDLMGKLMQYVASRTVQGLEVEISIVGSASKVPTRTYGSNEKLAKMRAENGKNELLKRAEAMGINTDLIVFKEVKSRVQGPAYRGDYKNTDIYKPWQYIEIIAR
jgi:hypothetical protein